MHQKEPVRMGSGFWGYLIVMLHSIRDDSVKKQKLIQPRHTPL